MERKKFKMNIDWIETLDLQDGVSHMAFDEGWTYWSAYDEKTGKWWVVESIAYHEGEGRVHYVLTGVVWTAEDWYDACLFCGKIVKAMAKLMGK